MSVGVGTLYITCRKEIFTVRAGRYGNNRIAIMLHSMKDDSLFTVLTVNMPDIDLEPGELCIKTWAENEEIVKDLCARGVFVDTGKRFNTGFVTGQIWKFREDFLPQYILDMVYNNGL